MTNQPIDTFGEDPFHEEDYDLESGSGCCGSRHPDRIHHDGCINSPPDQRTSGPYYEPVGTD